MTEELLERVLREIRDRKVAAWAAREESRRLAYSPGVLVDERILFVSGQGPLKDGQIVSGTIEEETRLALDNLRAVVEQAGADMTDVIRCGVYLADIEDFSAMNAEYERAFPQTPPARTTIGAALLGIKVEIDCIAIVPASSRKAA